MPVLFDNILYTASYIFYWALFHRFNVAVLPGICETFSKNDHSHRSVNTPPPINKNVKNQNPKYRYFLTQTKFN